VYHLSLVDKLYIWVDDPKEVENPCIPHDHRINVSGGSQVRNDAGHRMLIRRQNENVVRAVQMCIQDGIEWLMHLDSDELLFSPMSGKVSPSWNALAAAGVGQVTFANHEVCPVWIADNVFRDCIYFKANGRMPFNFYGNGKSAARVTNRIRPDGPHRFQGYDGRHMHSSEAVILHYTCATYDLWLRKYRIRGEFSNHWDDNKTYPIDMPFHLRSRDVCRACCLSGNYESAMSLFATSIVSDERRHALLRCKAMLVFEPLRGVRV